MWLKRILFTLSLFSFAAIPATISRVTNFVDGEVLYASDLNAEFNNIISSGVNNINNDNIIAGANIAPSKISTSIDGSGIDRDGTSGALSVKVDDSTIEISGDAIRLKDDGITSAKIADNAVTVDQLADNAVDTASIVDANVTNAKMATDSVGTSNIIAANVTNAKMAANSITTSNITDGNVTPAKLSAPLSTLTSSSGSQTFSSTTYVDVTNLQATVTSLGHPIEIHLQSDGATNSGIFSSGTGGIKVRIVRDSTTIGQYVLNAPSLIIPSSSINFVDTGNSAGSITYTIQAAATGAGSSSVDGVKLLVLER